MISVIITAHNEGDEVLRTVESVRRNTRTPYEIVIIDEASTDNSCDRLEGKDLRIITHKDRIGVAASRNIGCAAAKGKVFVFLDGHQRVSNGCLDQCAEAALKYQAIVWPDVRGLEDSGWTGHGASFCLCPKRGFFSGQWKRHASPRKISRITTLIVPGYVIPRAVFKKVHWVTTLRGWGGSEASIALKAFFLDVDILHICGPLSRHMFRKKIPYSTPWQGVWRNHALLARICFDDKTWFEHWLPEVFDKNLDHETRALLESKEVLAEREAFQSLKVRPDREFWRGLLLKEEPKCLKP